MANEDDKLKDEREEFEEAYDAESENRNAALEDLKFARLGEQWPEAIRRQRELDGRPILTINKLPAFIRQVVNDSRQNRPQIKVKPVDDNADVETAEIYEGLIRNIERTSKADVAYDTAVDYAVSMGFGYIRVNIDYEYDDTFDKCLRIERVANPFSVYGDPYSTSMDGSDWNRCWITELKSESEFKAKWKGAQKVDWEALGYNDLKAPWRESDDVLICESWTREETQREILLLSTGDVVGAKEYEAGKDVFMMAGVTAVNSRMAKAYKITQRIMTGAEILEENDWLGQYLPIIPVYGEELNVEGKRYFRSLISHAKDAQRMFNYWRTTATELVALAPRVPYIGEEGSFDADPNWATANTQSHPYLMFAKGAQMPQRQPLDGGAAGGAMQEALASADDMKAIIGMYDASLGQRSNETSGRAIMARQREGDVNTFNFADNLARSIRQVGNVLVDLIPKVYSGQRVVRIIGSDDNERVAKVGSSDPQDGQQQPQHGQQQSPYPEGKERIYDLGVGRYDVAVDTGPSYTTKREESAQQMTEFVRAYPQAAPLIGDLLVKALDWPQADEIAERLKAMLPQQINTGIPPELQQQIQQGQQHIQQQDQQLQQLSQENAQLKMSQQTEAMKFQLESHKAQAEAQKAQAEAQLAMQRVELDRQKMEIEAYKAVTERMQVDQMVPGPLPPEATPYPEYQEQQAPNVVEQLAQALASAMPKPTKMKRTIIRDPSTQLATHMVEEPVIEDAQDPNQPPMVN